MLGVHICLVSNAANTCDIAVHCGCTYVSRQVVAPLHLFADPDTHVILVMQGCSSDLVYSMATKLGSEEPNQATRLMEPCTG